MTSVSLGAGALPSRLRALVGGDTRGLVVRHTGPGRPGRHAVAGPRPVARGGDGGRGIDLALQGLAARHLLGLPAVLVRAVRRALAGHRPVVPGALGGYRGHTAFHRTRLAGGGPLGILVWLHGAHLPQLPFA